MPRRAPSAAKSFTSPPPSLRRRKSTSGSAPHASAPTRSRREGHQSADPEGHRDCPTWECRPSRCPRLGHGTRRGRRASTSTLRKAGDDGGGSGGCRNRTRCGCVQRGGFGTAGGRGSRAKGERAARSRGAGPRVPYRSPAARNCLTSAPLLLPLPAPLGVSIRWRTLRRAGSRGRS
jgi:hypothetical protein